MGKHYVIVKGITKQVASFTVYSLLIKYCLSVKGFGNIQEHKTFKGFNDNKRLLDRSQYFDKSAGNKISAMLPKSLKKSFDNGVILLVKKRRCNKSTSEIICNECNNQVHENKEI